MLAGSLAFWKYDGNGEPPKGDGRSAAEEVVKYRDCRRGAFKAALVNEVALIVPNFPIALTMAALKSRKVLWLASVKPTELLTYGRASITNADF